MRDSFDSVVKARHCKRAYLDKEVDLDVLRPIFEVAGQAASSKNTQPWQVALVQGKKVAELSEKLCALFDGGTIEKIDYQYTPEPMSEVFLQRARECGHGIFELKGIGRDDHEKRRAHSRENVKFFGAPVVAFFYLQAGAERGNFLDLGLYMQNVMLLLVDAGLGSCPQVSLIQFTETIKAFCGISPESTFVCGLSIGYPDESALVNTYAPKRLPLDDYFKVI